MTVIYKVSHVLLALSIILVSIESANCQNKVIKGDTAYWYRRNKELKDFSLTDFSTSDADFAFRFWGHGQVVELFKTGDKISGAITNYIYWSNIRLRKRLERTIFAKVKIDNTKASAIYAITQGSGILSLQSDKMIDKWSRGADGTTYIIEHSDKSEYWFKHYWTPSAQGSVPEALVVMKFLKSFSDTLQLSQRYKEFEDTLPKRGLL
jgi:hypothetical protein